MYSTADHLADQQRGRLSSSSTDGAIPMAASTDNDLAAAYTLGDEGTATGAYGLSGRVSMPNTSAALSSSVALSGKSPNATVSFSDRAVQQSDSVRTARLGDEIEGLAQKSFRGAVAVSPDMTEAQKRRVQYRLDSAERSPDGKSISRRASGANAMFQAATMRKQHGRAEQQPHPKPSLSAKLEAEDEGTAADLSDGGYLPSGPSLDDGYLNEDGAPDLRTESYQSAIMSQDNLPGVLSPSSRRSSIVSLNEEFAVTTPEIKRKSSKIVKGASSSDLEA